MGTTQPIRDKDELKNFIAYYEVAHPNIRNYTMIILGLYTALRISDVSVSYTHLTLPTNSRV